MHARGRVARPYRSLRKGAHHWLVRLARPPRADLSPANGRRTAMTSMTTTTSHVTGGVDTHGQTHHSAALDSVGRQLGDREFPTTPAGYRAFVSWLQAFGHLERVGMEGTGAYGAGLTRQLRAAGVT